MTQEMPLDNQQTIYTNNKRTVLVMGAGGSLGRAVAIKFAKKGFPLILAGRTMSKLEETKKFIFEAANELALVDCYSMDLTDEESIVALVRALKESNSEISVFVNCAAGFFKGSFEDIDRKSLSKLIDSNFKGVLIFLHQLIPLLRKNTPSDIVNVTSISSATTLDTSRSSTPHIASKAALHIFDKVLGRELSSTGIRVTTVAPDTLAKSGREGIALSSLADLIFQLVSLPPSIRIEAVVVYATGWKG